MESKAKRPENNENYEKGPRACLFKRLVGLVLSIGGSGRMDCHNMYSLIRAITVIAPTTVIGRIGVIRAVRVIRLIRVTWSIIRPVVVISG